MDDMPSLYKGSDQYLVIFIDILLLKNAIANIPAPIFDKQ